MREDSFHMVSIRKPYCDVEKAPSLKKKKKNGTSETLN